MAIVFQHQSGCTISIYTNERGSVSSFELIITDHDNLAIEGMSIGLTWEQLREIEQLIHIARAKYEEE